MLMVNKINSNDPTVEKSVNNIKSKNKKYATGEYQIWSLVCFKGHYFIISIKFILILHHLLVF
jgi:hypothetical protein